MSHCYVLVFYCALQSRKLAEITSCKRRPPGYRSYPTCSNRLTLCVFAPTPHCRTDTTPHMEHIGHALTRPTGCGGNRALAGGAQARGAKVVLLQTWGWLTGANPSFANYLTMQARPRSWPCDPEGCNPRPGAGSPAQTRASPTTSPCRQALAHGLATLGDVTLDPVPQRAPLLWLPSFAECPAMHVRPHLEPRP